MKLGVVAVALAAAILSTSAASATTLEAAGTGPYGVFKYASPVTAHIHSTTPAVNVNAYAGGFVVREQSVPDSSFVAWCLDILDDLFLPSAYNVTTDPFTPQQPLSTTVKNTIQKLFDTSFVSVDLDNAAQSAGFQLALWEIVNEPTGAYALGSGNFTATSISNGDALTAANSYLNNLLGPVTQAYKLTFYQSDPTLGHQSQNLVSAIAVPLPAAGLLLGSGLVGLFMLKRRRRPAPEPAIA
jgi:hypothetical protein